MTDVQQLPPAEENLGQSSQGQTKSSWVRKHLPVLVASAVAVALAATLIVVLFGGSSKGDVAQAHDVTVSFTLYDYDAFYSECVGEGGYSDIGPGTQVTIRDSAGGILSVGNLSAGTAHRAKPPYCVYDANLPDVPAGKGFYSVEVGSRGAITQSEAELAASGYRFDVTLGS